MGVRERDGEGGGEEGRGIERERTREWCNLCDKNNTYMSTYCRPWDKDRYFAPDVNAVTALLTEGKVLV